MPIACRPRSDRFFRRLGLETEAMDLLVLTRNPDRARGCGGCGRVRFRGSVGVPMEIERMVDPPAEEDGSAAGDSPPLSLVGILWPHYPGDPHKVAGIL
jgi:hypothetical protein